MDVQDIKNRFGIIGNSPLLNRAIEVARQVSPTDISVLITGESGSGKEAFSHIIHQLSHRKHGPFIAVNCGAIPEGTVDSELFGHVKGSFTNATEDRKGYFEVVNGGTIFMDEVAELPPSTQARLLRVLESGEYIRVGSSKVFKTDVRVVAATNKDVMENVQRGKFREDLYYRLNTVPLHIPALRERKEDIYLLFRKFIVDFSEKYRTPHIQLNEEARRMLENYSWPGNVRQLKNISEQIAVLEREREIGPETLARYLPREQQNLPMRLERPEAEREFSERDLLYKVLFDMKKDLVDLKKLVFNIIQHPNDLRQATASDPSLVSRLYHDPDIKEEEKDFDFHAPYLNNPKVLESDESFNDAEEVEESLSLEDQEADLIRKALRKHGGKRKSAAFELGISERTLYRKIKELNL
ncbi:regulatory Fis family protein [Anseongella ginsenosidimutans]|uniref:Regulatory Fis family protein n=1 Tax=Anseongella ginsenosidimutans TaxID=496056 RepID=A0A4R3L0S1_9SPHI|nr:sigma-54 dependent transcriptional regulator [Anseongella ginsenosidimutans]QEC51315.1 sigma-54-dependent Fis family transcriptional regulator [Anseongella ginsenosidimutans]TCS89992.1 regulatory Fis family protein [Anseongella ginsenosidimutans]